MMAMMAKLTTIPLEPAVRDRLRAFGAAGMTYSEILTVVLDKVEREDFVREMRRRAADPAVAWVDLQDVEWD